MSKKTEHEKMVEWYNPSQLLNTGIKTAISTIIGENADPRLVAASGKSDKFFDFSHQIVESDLDFEPLGETRNEIWIDYVSDVGDGWNPTYAVAYCLAKEKLKVAGLVEPLPRGELLVFGGDGVYPTATPEQYERKLLKPYRMAFNANRTGQALPAEKVEYLSLQKEAVSAEVSDLKKKPHVFALPGNHDWYDSLIAFQKIFCTHMFNGRIFAGGWRTRQKRSYFAVKLPQKWWLLGVDLQLSHNIDVPQLEYFEKVLQQMKSGDKVILCVPEPYWVKAIKYQDIPEAYEKYVTKEESIELFENSFRKKGIKIKLYLAGDLHHYRRFEAGKADETVHKITAGGGGAFLHPTHDFDFEKHKPKRNKKAEKFTLKTQYPTPEQSKVLDWQNFYRFIQNNKTFGRVTAVVYPLIALLIHGKVEENFSWTQIFGVTLVRLVEEPLSLLVVILMLAGLIFFTDSNSRLQKYLGGLIHGLFHLGAVFVLGWIGFFLMTLVFGAESYYTPNYYEANQAAINVVFLISIILVCGIGGYFFGSVIMGWYLFISLHFFGRHDNEAFSALHIEDYKNFLRMHIDDKGKLTVYAVKIENVPRENDWKPIKEEGKIISYEPLKEIDPALIEKIESFD